MFVYHNNKNTTIIKKEMLYLDVLAGVVARSLDNLDARFDDRRGVLGVGRRSDGRQDREIDAEWLVGQRACARNLLAQRLGRGLPHCLYG